MSQRPPRQLNEFINNSGVKVVRASPEPSNFGEFAKFVETDNLYDDLNNIVRNESDLRLKIFNARVDAITRPSDVFRFVRNVPLSSANQNGIKVVEVSAHYGRMQTGLKRSINFNYVPKLNPNIKPENIASQAWTYAQFKLAVDDDAGVIVKVYKDFMLLQGSFANGEENTPYRVANFILGKYLGGQSMVDKTLTFKLVEGEFRIPKKFDAVRMNAYLKQRHGFVENKLGRRTKVDPFLNEYKFYGDGKMEDVRKASRLSKDTLYEFRRFKQPVIHSISSTGVVKLMSDSLNGLKGSYATAMDVIKAYFLQANAPTENVNRVEKVRKRKPTAINKNTINAAITNITIGIQKCDSYSASQIKAICDSLGIPITKKKIGQTANGKPVMKKMDKKDLCVAINKVLNVRRAKIARPGNLNLREVALYKKRGIDDASLRQMLRNQKSNNINADLRLVKNAMKGAQKNKEGVPFKGEVEKITKKLVRERKMNTFLRKYNVTVRERIRQQLRNAKVLTEKSVERVAKQIEVANKKKKKALNYQKLGAARGGKSS